MEDFVGNKLEIGDTVVVKVTSSTTAELKKALVLGFTPKMIRVEVYGTYRKLQKIFPHNIVKVEFKIV